MSGYTIHGLDPALFWPLYGLDHAALAARGVVRMAVDAKPGFPCRVTLADAEPGEAVLLLNHMHQPAATPYHSAHAIFVREGAAQAAVVVGTVPDSLASRLLSVRAFDAADMMVDAEVLDGTGLDALLRQWFDRPDIAYIHVHNARRGCFAARADRGEGGWRSGGGVLNELAASG